MPAFKKTIRKVKRTFKPKSKSIVKSSPLTRTTNALATVSLHHNKLLATLFDSVYYEARSSREFENSAITTSTPGQLQLAYNTAGPTGKYLPLNLIEVTQIPNNGTGLSYLQAQLYFPTSDPTVPTFIAQSETLMTRIGANDGGAIPVTTAYNRTMMEYYHLRLDLYQRDKFTTEYNVAILKISDEMLQPSAGSISNKTHNNFWNMLSKPYYTNTIVPSDPRLKADLQGKYQILWEKTYKLKEKLNDTDSFTFKRVNLFKKINKILKFNELPADVTTSGDNPNTFQTTPAAGNTTNSAPVKDRIYIMIRANNTKDYNVNTLTTYDDTTAQALVDIPSYNLYFKSKHTIPQS